VRNASTIRVLPAALVSRIAAGEVIERPAAVAKELVENALDAGSTRISVALEAGGVARLIVEDDGSGIEAAELPLAVLRHATSKLADEGLVRIATLGFRGEALASIGSVARLELTSRTATAPHASRITVEAGEAGPVAPAAGPRGTRVMVADLFHTVPARLKFLRSPRTEADAVVEAVRRLALAHPEVAFRVSVDGHAVLEAEAEPQSRRLARLLGEGFAEGSLPVAAERGSLGLEGRIGAPGLHRATPRDQHLFVNGRPVRDPVLRTALKVAALGLLPEGRHAVAALWLAVPAEEVDVNVHPAKTEVRFREPALVRSLVIAAVRDALGQAGGAAARPMPRQAWPSAQWPSGGGGGGMAAAAALAPHDSASGFAEPVLGLAAPPWARPPGATLAEAPPMASNASHPLGAAKAQLMDTWILAETADGEMILVDAHAAHERIVHERLSRSLAEGRAPSQALLLPAVVPMAPRERGLVLGEADALAALGLEVEGFGQALLVRALPVPIASADPGPLLADIADELAELGASTALEARLDRLVARLACHGSVRSGRRLTLPEMDALLRAIETTPRAGTCSHGRPTWIRLGRAELERLFGRR